MSFFKALWEAICETTVEQIEEIKQAEPPSQEQSVFGDGDISPSLFPDSNDIHAIGHEIFHPNHPNNW